MQRYTLKFVPPDSDRSRPCGFRFSASEDGDESCGLNESDEESLSIFTGDVMFELVPVEHLVQFLHRASQFNYALAGKTLLI